MNATRESVKPARIGRAERRPRDMIISLAVLLVPIGAFFLLWGFLTSENPVSVIDPAPAYGQAAGLGLDAPEPQGLSEDWRPMSSGVSHDDGAVTLRVGYYTPSGGGIQFVVSQRDSAELMEEELRAGAKPVGAMTLGGITWQSYVTVEGNSALIYTDKSVTWLVHGDTSAEELASFAKALS